MAKINHQLRHFSERRTDACTSRSPDPELLAISKPTSNQLRVFQAGAFVPGGAVDKNKPTIVLTHGWNSSPADWPKSLAAALPGVGTDVNVLAWDWSTDADSG